MALGKYASVYLDPQLTFLLVSQLLTENFFRSYCRKDALAVGKFALNLTDVPVPSTGGDGGESFGRLLFELLEQLVTKGHYLAMSLQNLNTQPMVPKKDYAQNRLVAGRLQLSSQTHLVLDETAMTEGKKKPPI